MRRISVVEGGTSGGKVPVKTEKGKRNMGSPIISIRFTSQIAH